MSSSAMPPPYPPCGRHTRSREDARMADVPPTDDLALGDDLRAFVDASPSPGHAVAELARRLTAAGFTELAETDRGALSPGRGALSAGGRHFVVRYGSLIAFRLGSGSLGDTGMRLVGAHTDSPTFKV